MAKRALNWFAGFVLLISAALFLNFGGVMFASMNYWFPRMAAGHITFPQVLYAEWVLYYTSHRYGRIVLDDLPGLALVAATVLAVGCFKWRQHNLLATGTARAELGPMQDTESIWPPAPKR